ncbi:N-6 DNA methylase [Candidatus Hepatincolaceae symbiont of Richtersius coronifer]
MNERITENIVRDHFKNDILFLNTIIEEQKSFNVKINKLLQNASKSGNGIGRPEFLISFKDNLNLIIVVECKADLLKHESENLDKYNDYAVDGVLLYSAFLAKEYDVLSIAVSGYKQDDIKVSYFIQRKNKIEQDRIFGNKLLPIEDLIAGVYQNEIKQKTKYEELLNYSKILNEKLQQLKIKEDKRSLLVSGILIALKNKDFYRTYSLIENPKDLTEYLERTIINQLKYEKLQDEKYNKLKYSYSFISNQNILLKKYTENEHDVYILKDLIDEVDENINNYVRTYKYYDVLGQFYIEFLKYSNSDKGLGIVLTPPHITEFFCDIVDLKATDIVYDNCTGTCGFLVSAMKYMINKANGDKALESNIRQNQLFGVEYQPEIYPLAFSNMFLHGDGKSNIFNGSCFENDIKTEIRSKKPTVGFLNPPYKSDKKKDIEELEFVLNSLECLEKKSLCVAIIPMSCVLFQRGKRLSLKEKLLKNHTLKAVFSMPNELFFNSDASTNTCVVVFEAHIPHNHNKETFFGYFKDDSFAKRKEKGRYDYNNNWYNIKTEWLDLYFNNKIKDGLSVSKKITEKDEWCAEAYMETDCSQLTKDDFIKIIKNYCVYSLSNNHKDDISSKPFHNDDIIKLDIENWQYIHLKKLFNITGTKTTPPLELLNKRKGEYPYVTTQATNNSVEAFYDFFTEKGNVLTIDSAVVGYTSYQMYNFSASDHVEKLEPLFNMNKYIALFLTTLINKEQYRYNYGRKASQTRLKAFGKIKLPLNSQNEPDWQFMEDYIKTLPYSSSL